MARKRKEEVQGFGESSAAFLGGNPATPAGPAARRIGDALILSGVADKAMVERLIRSAGRTLRSENDVLIRAERPKAETLLRRVDERTVVPLPSSVEARGDRAAAALAATFGPALAERAASRRSEEYSFRSGPARWQRLALAAFLMAAGAATTASPPFALGLAVWLGCLVIMVNALLWTIALVSAVGAERKDTAVRQPDLPKISLIVALYKEPETAGLLIQSLARLRYPPGKLEVKLVLEAGDDETLTALAALPQLSHFEILIAPPGGPRTKPRALNYALDFTTGDIIGVYDAEDRPARDQLLKAASAIVAGGRDVACVQARLGYYNIRENWFTRCFELEYAGWFDTLLPGLRRADLPLPLGGTSLFVRRTALEELGGWDSHNVTEDADLGMVLARSGYRTELIDSLTEEEASSRPLAWVKQRSRWLKGYMATWSTHMRSPRALLRDLGVRRFIGFNAIMLGAVAGYLLMPFLWLASILLALGANLPFAEAAAIPLTLAATVAAAALVGASASGLRRRRRLSYIAWIVTAPVYWLFGVAAAYLAFWELMTAPTLWRKTRHGVGEISAIVRNAALDS